MVTFLRELAASQSVAQAARGVGMSRQSAYKLRNRLAGTPFALGWEVALEAGLHQLAHAVMDRALNGEDVPHYYHGELVGTSKRFDNRLAAWMLDNPWKIGRAQIAREFVAEGWDKLLERIEAAALDWEEGETLPGLAPWPIPEPERVERAPGEDDDDEEDDDEDTVDAIAQRQEDEFSYRSWYYADGADLANRLRRGARR